MANALGPSLRNRALTALTRREHSRQELKAKLQPFAEDPDELDPLLDELEKRGWLKCAWETATNGRKRRYYRITAAGRKQLAPLREQWRLFFVALNRLAGVRSA